MPLLNPDFNKVEFDHFIQHSDPEEDTILDLLAVSNIKGLYAKSDSCWARTIYADEGVARLYCRTVKAVAEAYKLPEDDNTTK